MKDLKFSDLVLYISNNHDLPIIASDTSLQLLPGSEDKYYCFYEGERWILKDSLYDARRKEYALFPYCEHVGSTLLRQIGIEAQTTKLVKYNSRVCVICKDFAVDTELREFKELHQSSVGTDLSNKEYTYEDVIHVLRYVHNFNDKDIDVIMKQFWRMFLGDAIVGNRDRHEGNWGFLISASGLVFSPVYDNGASLFPNVNLFNFNKSFVKERVYKMPGSQFKAWKEGITDRPMRTNFYEIIKNYDNNILLAELEEFKKINIVEAINTAVSGIPEVIKMWFSFIIYCRFNCLILNRDFDLVYGEAYSNYIKESKNGTHHKHTY